MHRGIQRHAPEKPRGRIPEAIGRQRVRRLVNGQGKQKYDELDENEREVDAGQEGVSVPR